MQSATLRRGNSGERKSDSSERAGRRGRWLMPATTGAAAIIEVIVGMAVVIGICYLLKPADPLLLSLGFPWIWLVAAVFALRYGTLLGGLAGLCIVAAWYAFYGYDGHAQVPTAFVVGGFVLMVIAGQYCDVLTQRLNRLRKVNQYLNDRLVSITNSHYLLRVSHERLERDLLTKPSTLRDAVRYLRDLSALSTSDEPLPHVQSMLQFAALSCQIEAGAVFPVSGSGLAPRCVASVGERFDLDVNDPLVTECFENRKLAHVGPVDALKSAYLVCVPIVAESGRMRGMLVVRKMPFLSLNFDNLQLLLVLLAYYADGIEQKELIAPVQEIVPECPTEFALELGRLGRMCRVSNVRSSIVALVFRREAIGRSLHDHTIRQHRALDLLWTFDTDRAQVVFVLMPLTDDNGISGYLARLDDSFNKQFDTSLAQAHVAVHSAGVDPNETGKGLRELFERCQYHG